MRYSQIRAFHHVAIHGGFSRAAQALSLTQPALSEQVRRLEGDYDLLLFDRTRKQITLTPAGERLLAHTRKLFETEQLIAEELSESRTAPEGQLRIIADSAHHLTRRLQRYRARYPRVSVTLRSGNTAEILSALRNYEAEIGVVGSPSPGPDMEIRCLGASPIVAMAARGYLAPHSAPHPEPMTLTQIAQRPLIFREVGSKTRQKLEEEATRQGLCLRPAVEAEGREAVREVVASGAGIGFVSEAEFGYDSRLAKIAIAGVALEMRETLICLHQRNTVRAIRAFMDVPDD